MNRYSHPASEGSKDIKETVQNELKRRAAALAQETVRSRETRDRLEIMPFQLAAEHYAVEMRFIREVRPLTSILPIPHTPPFVLGVTHAQGEVCSVVDLKQFFSLPSAGITNLNKLIILEHEQMCFGILADDVLGSTTVDRKEILSVDEWAGIDSRYLSGVTKERLIVLDAEKLLTDQRLIVNETAES